MNEKTDNEECGFCGKELTEIGNKKPCCFLRRVMDNFTGEFCTFDTIIDEYEEAIEEERKKHEEILDARRDALHKTLKSSKNETEKLMLMAHLNEIANIEEEIKLSRR